MARKPESVTLGKGAAFAKSRRKRQEDDIGDTDFRALPKGKRMARSRKAAETIPQPAEHGKDRLYTLEVFLLSGPITEKFAKKNPVVSRTMQIRGDQTLEDLHHAIFDAFGRWEEHMYEFQFGKGPMDPTGRRYVLPGAFAIERGEQNPPPGRVDQTTSSHWP